MLSMLKPDPVVLFVDALDAVTVKDSAEILRRFKEFGAPMIFAAESVCDTLTYPYSW